jgi:hypothetical protein
MAATLASAGYNVPQRFLPTYEYPVVACFGLRGQIFLQSICSGHAGHHRPIAEQRAQVENELPRLEAERDVLRIGMLSREEVLDEAKDLAARWAELSWEHRRQIVETITDRIVIGKEGVEISLLQVPFGSDDQMATKPLGPRFRGDERVLGFPAAHGLG